MLPKQSCLWLCSLVSWLLQLSRVWLSSLSRRIKLQKVQLSPLAAHWWMNAAQIHFAVLQPSQPYRSWLFDWAPSMLRTNPAATLFFWYSRSSSCLCVHSLAQGSFSYAAPFVCNSLHCNVRSSRILSAFKPVLKYLPFELSDWQCAATCEDDIRAKRNSSNHSFPLYLPVPPFSPPFLPLFHFCLKRTGNTKIMNCAVICNY